MQSSSEHTSIVEGLNTIQVLVHLVLDSVQLGPRHASIDQGLSCLLAQKHTARTTVYILKPKLVQHVT